MRQRVHHEAGSLIGDGGSSLGGHVPLNGLAALILLNLTVSVLCLLIYLSSNGLSFSKAHG